jgi:hypothetical protein
MRINKIRTLGIVAAIFAVTIVANAAINYNQLADLQEQVKGACPARWEGHLSQIEYETGDSLWQGNLRDKAAFVTFASTHLKDVDGSYQINSFNDIGAVILTCGDLKSKTFALMNQDHGDVINAFTFASDDDEDGVINGMDICADTTDSNIPSGHTYSVNAFGCTPWQADTDGDGVTDHIDQCLATPVGSLPVASNGCADSDGDGTADQDDPYPYQNATMCTP